MLTAAHLSPSQYDNRNTLCSRNPQSGAAADEGRRGPLTFEKSNPGSFNHSSTLPRPLSLSGVPRLIGTMRRCAGCTQCPAPAPSLRPGPPSGCFPRWTPGREPSPAQPQPRGGTRRTRSEGRRPEGGGGRKRAEHRAQVCVSGCCLPKRAWTRSELLRISSSGEIAQTVGTSVQRTHHPDDSGGWLICSGDEPEERALPHSGAPHEGHLGPAGNDRSDLSEDWVGRGRGERPRNVAEGVRA